MSDNITLTKQDLAELLENAVEKGMNKSLEKPINVVKKVQYRTFLVYVVAFVAPTIMALSGWNPTVVLGGTAVVGLFLAYYFSAYFFGK